MIAGRVLRGRHCQAGCLLGHFTVNHNGGLCTCGNIGCVEEEASTASLPKMCRAHPRFADSPLAEAANITYADVFAHAEAGDVCAREIRDHSIRVWSAAAVTWIHAYDPEVVVFGGGVMASERRILPEVEAFVHRHAWTQWGKVAVRAAALGTRSALFGAIPIIEARGDERRQFL